MEALVPIVIRLQEAFTSIGTKSNIELPRLVSLGAQSAGKSSVIESIVGRDFLPRGSGIVTRCPLVLNLRRIDQNNDGNESANMGEVAEYGVFHHKPDRKFYDFDEIRTEIESRTVEIAGIQKAISSTEILLTIYSPKLLDLTLVDLPGLTKVPTHGQPADIDVQIKNLVTSYIKKANTLILALSPANVDLANSDSLQMAKEYDPQGERTIGVITKIDLMDDGTNAIDLLNGSTYELKLGYYGVKCRSQQNIIDNMSIEEAVKAEARFFSTHEAYAGAADKLGIPFLTSSLNRILVNHIKKTLPQLHGQIKTSLADKEFELAESLKDAFTDDAMDDGSFSDPQPLVLHLVNKF